MFPDNINFYISPSGFTNFGEKIVFFRQIKNYLFNLTLKWTPSNMNKRI